MKNLEEEMDRKYAEFDFHVEQAARLARELNALRIQLEEQQATQPSSTRRTKERGKTVATPSTGKSRSADL